METYLDRSVRWSAGRWTWRCGSSWRPWRCEARRSNSRRSRRAPKPSCRRRFRPGTRHGTPSAASCWNASASAATNTRRTDCLSVPVRRRYQESSSAIRQLRRSPCCCTPSNQKTLAGWVPSATPPSSFNEANASVRKVKQMVYQSCCFERQQRKWQRYRKYGVHIP